MTLKPLFIFTTVIAMLYANITVKSWEKLGSVQFQLQKHAEIKNIYYGYYNIIIG